MKLEFFDDIYAEHEDRVLHPWHKYRRGAGIVMATLSAFFLASVLILCWLQTGNLLKGETTCERFAKTNYKSLHKFHQEAMSLELSMEQFMKKRYSVMSIDDNTNPTNACCGNITGMCCNQYIMSQDEILQKTYDAYGYKLTDSNNNSRSKLLGNEMGVINESPEKTEDYGTSTDLNKSEKNEFKMLLKGKE